MIINQQAHAITFRTDMTQNQAFAGIRLKGIAHKSPVDHSEISPVNDKIGFQKVRYPKLTGRSESQ